MVTKHNTEDIELRGKNGRLLEGEAKALTIDILNEIEKRGLTVKQLEEIVHYLQSEIERFTYEQKKVSKFRPLQ